MIDELPLTEFVAASCATGAVAALAFFDQRVRPHLLLIWACTCSVLLVGLDHASAGLLFGVALAAGARFVTVPRHRWVLLVGGLVAVVHVLTQDLQAELRLGSLLVAAVAGPMLWSANRTFGQAPMIAVIAGSAVGIYVNVPDTEQIAVVAAGLVVLAATMLVFRQLTVGPLWFGSLALVAALVVSAAAVGARGRPESFVGVVGALGVLLAEPVAARLRRDTRAHPFVLIAVHAGAVFIASRIAGVRDVEPATAIVLGTVAAAVALLALLPRKRNPADL